MAQEQNLCFSYLYGEFEDFHHLLPNHHRKQYPNHQWVDLDIDYGYPKYGILPEAYCKIVKNMIYNAIYLKDKIYLF